MQFKVAAGTRTRTAVTRRPVSTTLGLNSENEHVAPPTTAHAALRGRAPPPARAQRYEREDRSRDERDRCGRLGVRAARSGARRGARGEHEIACELDGVGGVG